MKITVVTQTPLSKETNFRRPHIIDLFQKQGIKIKIYSFRLSKRHIPLRFLAKIRLLFEKTDVYWCFFPLYINYCRFPVVVDYDDPLSQLKPEFKSIEKIFFNKDSVSYVVTSTQKLKDYLAENVGVKKEKITVIPTALDLTKFRPYNIKAEPIIGYVGAILSKERLKPLLNSMEIVWKKGQKLKLMLLGKVENQILPYLNKHRNNIIAPGFVSPDKLPFYINKMRVCIHSMPWPGRLSTKLLQYMACAKPIIALETSENEIITKAKAGMIVSSEEEMAEAIIKLANDTGLAMKFGSNGRSFVEENHNQNIVYKNYIKLLEEYVVHKK